MSWDLIFRYVARCRRSGRSLGVQCQTLQSAEAIALAVALAVLVDWVSPDGPVELSDKRANI